MGVYVSVGFVELEAIPHGLSVRLPALSFAKMLVGTGEVRVCRGDEKDPGEEVDRQAGKGSAPNVPMYASYG